MHRNKLSAYILTFNSEKYLYSILNKLALVADEILIIDSGSSDNTENIVSEFPKARFIYRQFKDFKSQRIFAANSCKYDNVLFLDSDEIPDETFISDLIDLKEKGFEKEAYLAQRHWFVLGKKVRVMYPIVSPDFPVRLYNKNSVNFEHSSLVHETPVGYSSSGKIQGKIEHITFASREELEQKLQFYSEIAARDLLLKNKKPSLLKAYLSGFGAFIKWYFLKMGFLDARVGWILGGYAFRYSKLKYLKAIKILKTKVHSTSS